MTSKASGNAIDYSDRRSTPRVHTENLFCDVSLPDKNKVVSGKVLNISEQGLMVALKEPLILSRTSNICVHLPDTYGDVTLKGVVSWVDAIDGVFLGGVDFPEKKESKTIETLRKYVSAVLNSTNTADRRKIKHPSDSIKSNNPERRTTKVDGNKIEKQVSKQQRIPVSIIGTGFYVPDRVITNKEYEKDYGVNSEWILQSTGIAERRMVSKSQTIADLATNAAKRAIKNAGISPEEIDLIILSSTCADFVSPPTSCIIQRNLSAKNASCFDLNAACMGYVWAINTASSYIGSNLFNTVLVVAAEITTPARNFENKATFHLLGDGAGAAILRRDETGNSGLLASYSGADGSQWNIASIMGFMQRSNEPKASLKYFNMEGLDIYKFAINAIPHSINTVMEKAGIKKEDVSLIVPHQANLRILESAQKRSGFPREKFFFNVHKYGNSSSATVAIALADAMEQGLLKKGDIAILVGFGSGLAWGATAIRI